MVLRRRMGCRGGSVRCTRRTEGCCKHLGCEGEAGRPRDCACAYGCCCWLQGCAGRRVLLLMGEAGAKASGPCRWPRGAICTCEDLASTCPTGFCPGPLLQPEPCKLRSHMAHPRAREPCVACPRMHGHLCHRVGLPLLDPLGQALLARPGWGRHDGCWLVGVPSALHHQHDLGPHGFQVRGL